jgi:hypothetical protein
MKIYIFFTCFFFLILLNYSCNDKSEFIKKTIVLSKIDSLNTINEIEKLIQDNDTNNRDFKLKSILDLKEINELDSLNIILAKKLKLNSCFEKVDLDNNGYTDIIATGGTNTNEFDCHNFYKILVMNYPNSKYKIRIKYLEWGKSFVPKIEYINSMPVLVIYNHKYKNDWSGNKIIRTKTFLTYKFNNLVEFNKNPKKNNISKIEFISGPCFGTCPFYELNLNRDSISVFKAIQYNFNKNTEYPKEEGTFITNLDENKFKKLEEILNYIDFEKLKEEYSVPYTCSATANLKITYNKGKVKKISDYGLVGTYGLKLLYKEFDSLRFNQNWKKIK